MDAHPPERGSPRIDPLSGDRTVVVAGRQSRPNLPDDGCPFCVGGREAPDPYEVRWFPNRWPPLPDGRAEVVLYTPDHEATFASLGIDGAQRVVDLWAERSAELGARPEVAYVLVFENRGPEVGATISHPHGQIYAYDHVPARALSELALATTGDPLAAGPDRDGPGDAGPGPEGSDTDGSDSGESRLVSSGAGWRAWVPWAATWPYELVVAPDAAWPDLPSLDAGARRGLAEVLVDVLGRLDALFEAPMPYMLWFHQRPFDGGDHPAVRVHAHITPIWRAAGVPRFVAAAELGGGEFFNPVDPVAAAAALRAVTP